MHALVSSTPRIILPHKSKFIKESARHSPLWGLSATQDVPKQDTKWGAKLDVYIARTIRNDCHFRDNVSIIKVVSMLKFATDRVADTRLGITFTYWSCVMYVSDD